ncbi:MAG: MBOAT family O-acyltransferase, partial [Pseudomonadota bacterium]
FVENFNAPYSSRSVTEFWRRWHISLSAWLRDYLYVPLGGNRHGSFKTYRNLILTMALGGLWHGSNWTFLIWGVWHGGIMAVERALGAKGKETVWPPAIAWPLTMVFVLIGWVVFRAPTLSDAATMYIGMAGLNGILMSPESIFLLRPTEILFLMAGISICLLQAQADRLTRWRFTTLNTNIWQATAGARTVTLFIACASIMQARAESPFLYFQF